jgi:hypothetical protein
MWSLSPSDEEDRCADNGVGTLGEVLSELSEEKDGGIEQTYLMSVTHSTLIRISQKYALSQVGGGNRETAIPLAKMHGEVKRDIAGQNFQARGPRISTLRANDLVSRAYRQNQEQEDPPLDRISIWG